MNKEWVEAIPTNDASTKLTFANCAKSGSKKVVKIYMDTVQKGRENPRISSALVVK